MQTEISKVTREEVTIQTEELRGKINTLVISSTDSADEAKKLEKSCLSLEKFVEGKRDELVRPLNDTVKQINAAAKELAAPILEAKESIRTKQIAYAQALEAERLKKENEVFEIIRKINSITDDVDLELMADTTANKDMRIVAAFESRRNFFAEQERLKKFQEEQKAEQARLNKIREEQGIEAAKLAKKDAEQRLHLQQIKDEQDRIFENNKKQEADDLAAAEEARRAKEVEASKVKGIRKVLKYEVSDESLLPRQFLSADEKKILAALKEGVREIPGVRIWAEDKIA